MTAAATAALSGKTSAFDKTAMIASIRAMAPRVTASFQAIDSDRNIPDDLIEEMRSMGLYRLGWPTALGGYAADPMTQIEILEEVARLDGSLGWIATFAALSVFTAAKLEPDARRELFPSPDTIAAGQYAPTGRAERVPGGYRVTARWPFGSGCRHADIMSGGVTVIEDGSPRTGADGQPETRTVVFRATDCNIDLETWDTVGLRGSGSHDYTVKDLFVPDEHSFDPLAPAHIEGPLFAFPPMFLFTHLPIPLGIARAAIDSAVLLGSEKRIWPGGRYLKEDGKFEESIAEAEATLGAARGFSMSVIADLWESLSKGDEPTSRQRAMFRLCLVHATRMAKDVVTLTYDAAATSAIQSSSPFDRQLRDMLTLAQHRVVQKKMYRPIGKALLGLGASDPFL